MTDVRTSADEPISHSARVTFIAPPAELAAEAFRITRRVHELRHPIADQAARFAKAVDGLVGLSDQTTVTSAKCEAWRARIATALEQLDELTITARPALEEAADVLGDLAALVQADERRRAEIAEVEARRRKIDAEVQRLADAEDAAEQATRRERLEQTARDRLATKASA